MKAKQFNKSEKKELDSSLSIYGLSDIIKKSDKVEVIETDFKFIKVNGSVDFFYHEDTLLPSLRFLLKHKALKEIVVDMGAVKFVVNGADIMRPGITEIPEGLKNGDFVSIVDTNNKKPLAVGIALLDEAEMKNATSGKVVKNLHYIGDAIWNSS